MSQVFPEDNPGIGEGSESWPLLGSLLSEPSLQTGTSLTLEPPSAPPQLWEATVTKVPVG